VAPRSRAVCSRRTAATSSPSGSGELEYSRRRVVDSAEAERRRIERDLHDGAQQRLVALAMTLGRAKARLAEDDDARRLVDEAHAEAKLAITELRDLTRGLHPPVLSDRGLDAALSALAARSPVPVDVEVDVGVRPTPTVEAIAYFVVAEALTNVAKHSGARRASVVVRRVDGTLRVVVRDDGWAAPTRTAGRASRGSPTASPVSTDGCTSTAPSGAPPCSPWRCHAGRDRRGLGAAPRGDLPPARGRGRHRRRRRR
jgi:signal transduction histidine kinase